MDVMTEWSDIPGYEGRYQINPKGQVRSFCHGRFQAKEPYEIKPHNAGNGWWVVRLMDAKGKVHVHPIGRVMAMTFIGIKEGQCAYHKNGCRSDWALENIGVRWRNGKAVKAQYRKRPVRKRNRTTGEIVKVYPSISEAARAEYMSPSTMYNHCRGIWNYDEEEYIFEYDDVDDDEGRRIYARYRNAP